MALSRAALAAGLFLLVRIAYRRLRGRDGLGLGDVKLAGAAGAWLSLQMLPISIEIAAITALAAYVFRQRKRARVLRAAGRIPFGAFFAPAIWLGWMLDSDAPHPELGGFTKEASELSRGAGKDAFSRWMAWTRRRASSADPFSPAVDGRRPGRARGLLCGRRAGLRRPELCAVGRDLCSPCGAGRSARANLSRRDVSARAGRSAEFRRRSLLASPASETGLPEAQYFLGLMYDKGQGVAQDFVVAHAWLNLAVAHAEPRLRSRWVLIRNAVASKMTEAQLAEARRLAYTWRPEPPPAFEWRPDPPR